ncbi:hypothetical protein FOMPIDRAFT_1015436 [Fomitopsis schrenkii]|uniref:Uncharacterized protein n=1 Tax=Fomitopsis schrenkii TaxID=2126942 RepID=S8FV25_FOMSC|nr:hypothetical protein FOMPIDRAFT_1015436 [Fomitopsis schrenkii]
MTSTVMQGTQPNGQWTKMTLSEQDNEVYKSLLCPRHPPMGRPRYSLVFPPELLIKILLEIRSDYLWFLFLTETRDEEEIEERIAANPFRAMLHVSQQFREIAFEIIRDAFGVQRESDGCLPNDAWSCLRYTLKHVHLLWRGTPELIEEHVKGGEARVVPPMLNYYVQVSRLVPRGNGRPPLDVVFKELGYKSRRHALIEYGHNGALQPTLMRYAFAVVFCVQFCLVMEPTLPLLRLWTPQTYYYNDSPNMILVASYVNWYFLFDTTTRTVPRSENDPLLPVPISLPNGVNADLIARYKFLEILWKYQKLPVVASDQGLQEMSQVLLDMCVKISMPHRKPPVSEQGSRRRRVSFSEFQDIKAIPRPSYVPHCLCEKRLRMRE